MSEVKGKAAAVALAGVAAVLLAAQGFAHHAIGAKFDTRVSAAGARLLGSARAWVSPRAAV